MRVAVILTARPSWAKLEPVCRALKARPDVELQIIACASALLERYGNVSAVVESQGYAIADKVYSVVEGASLLTSAIEGSVLKAALANSLTRLRSDVVVVCADRHEIIDAASAARQLELPICHLQGGELSGSVDNDIRDAVTQLATYHCVATRLAGMVVLGKTGSDRIVITGCPSIDLAKQALTEPPVTAEELGGAGEPIDLTQPFVVVLQHPVTSEVEQAGEQMRITLEATEGYQRIVMWSGQDAGADATSKVIRTTPGIHTLRSLPPTRFLRLLTQCACIVGNSSASVREASYLGTPAVVIGTRQTRREHGANARKAWCIPHDALAIRAAIQQQIAHGRYKSSDLYGNGDAGEKIAEVICGRGQAAESANGAGRLAAGA